MTLPSIDSLQKTAEKSVSFIEWLVELIRKESWVQLLVLLGVAIFIFGNPKTLSFAADFLPDDWNLEQLLPSDFWIYWLVTVVGLFLLAFIITFFTLPNVASPGLSLSERSAIKGLISFGFEDAALFEKLERARVIRDVLNALCDSSFHFGILSGESGCGKSSLLQAGIWPRLAAHQHQALYVRCNERQPLESIRHAIHHQFKIPHEQLETLTLASMLELAASHHQAAHPETLILMLDQFEQFFIQQRYKEDRQSFIEALREWYQQQPSHPVKILVSLRSDLVGRMIELQNALGYTLGPNQNFLLEEFEPGEAANVFQTIVTHEHIECDENFIEELCANELADPRDGLISPVDLQILAWMIAGSDVSSQGGFDQAAFQSLGGLEGLLNRFLERILKSRETDERRQVVIKLLLALIDLDNNLRAGVLTESELQQKLANSLAPTEIYEALQWLIRSDVRLVTPRPKGDIQGYELSHERIIVAIRRVAGQELTATNQANQLLQQRVNEWLGNECSSHYLLNWRELRLIQQNIAYLIWQPKKQQKEAFIEHSRRRYGNRRNVVIGLALLGAVGYGLSVQPKFQIWRVQQQLVTLNENPRSLERRQQSTAALVAIGAWKDAVMVAHRILAR